MVDTEICVSCGKEFDIEEMIDINDGYLCYRCEDDDEPIAQILYGKDEIPIFIKHYTSDDGNFEAVYHKTDGWRGYYEVKPIDKDAWVELFTDAILYGHCSEKMLKELHDTFLEKTRELNIEVARSSCVSSNVFFTNMQWFVRKNDFGTAVALLNALKLKVDYDDPRYSQGIIMGHDEFKKIQNILSKNDILIKTDADLLKLVEDKSLDELKNLLK